MKQDPRAVVVRILLRIMTEKPHLGLVRNELSAETLILKDRRFVQRLVLGVLRRLSEIDYLIKKTSHKRLGRLDSEVWWILRGAVFELLDSNTPTRAVVHEWVGQCRNFRKSSATSFVNGVLREYLRCPVTLPMNNDSSSLAIRHSHPEWLVQRYLSRYGLDTARQMMKHNNKEPEHFLWVNPFQFDVRDLCRSLEDNGFPCQPVNSLPNCLRTSAAVSGHPLYKRGCGIFIDISSQWVANLPDLSNCSRAGDLCAAPGGKSFILASRLPSGSRLIASDVSISRILSMRQRVLKLGIPDVSLQVVDLNQNCFIEEIFDFVLLDVPCSGLGTLSSNPDIKWRFQKKELSRLQDYQLELLRSVFPLLKRGRELIYSTCSTEEEENEEVVMEFLQTEPQAKTLMSFEKTSPFLEGGQVFFAARIGRK